MTAEHAHEVVPVGEDLAALAAAMGVATEYFDQQGNHVDVSAPTVVAVLAALAIDASTPDAIAHALEQVRLRPWRRMLPSVFVARQGEERRIGVHVPHGDGVTCWIELDTGERRDLAQLDHWVDPVEVDGILTGEASFGVPGDLPLGYHQVHAQSGYAHGSAPLISTPFRLDTDHLIGGRQWGLMTQLYATRSRASWGLGDLADLQELCRWGGGLGAGFVLINPLHAASPEPPMTSSPYLPVTRRFANPIYLRVEDIPEFALLPAAVSERVEQLADQLRALNAVDGLIDRDAVWSAKRTALEIIFRAGRSPERESSLDDYIDEQGAGLVDFATWCAIVDATGSMTDWPHGLERPDSPGVVQFREEHADDVRFHMWLQWLVREQLAAAQAAAKGAGMRIGVMHDLAVGVHPEGADAWALQDVLANGVGVGAPPDMYNQLGQNWHQPPWRPDALAEAGFVPYRNMLRTVLHSAGGLRIDHVLGLFRMWWVPAGMPASSGTFVRFDYDAMIGILALEAQRANCVVVGEDLGTVEAWVQEVLLERGILGTSILWFEGNEDGTPKAPSAWRTEVLASVTVHDLPPTAGYLRDEHVRIRAELGLLAVPVEEERARAAHERNAWVEVLVAHGWLDDAVDLTTDEGLDAVTVALHRAAAASPALLLGIGVPDLVGDRRAQNQPGTDMEYPNWRVPVAGPDRTPVLLEDIEAGSPLQSAILATLT